MIRDIFSGLYEIATSELGKMILKIAGSVAIIIAVLTTGFFALLIETERSIVVGPMLSVVKPCIGVFDDKDPRFKYQDSVRNVVAAVIGSETIIVPVWVVLRGSQCPYAFNPGYPLPDHPHEL